MGGCQGRENRDHDDKNHLFLTKPSSSPQQYSKELHNKNLHIINPDVKIHTVISTELDYNHELSMTIPLGEVTDEQLLAEVARRKFDLHDKITDNLVKESYSFLYLLGQGASGEVYLTQNKLNGNYFACKIVKKDSNINDIQSMSTEIEILKRLNHRHLIKLNELYETPKCIWIIMEYINGGDLGQVLATSVDFCEVFAAKIMRQMLLGIQYMHNNGIVHRDLKLENILLTKSSNGIGDVKIADFGLSALVRICENGYDPEESSKRKRYNELKDMWGTKEYFAPEIIRQAYGPQADIWAAGCVLFELVTGEQAFPVREGDTEGKFYTRICKGEYDAGKLVSRKISVELRELISCMLMVDPISRYSASDCLRHQWITGECHTDLHYTPLTEAREIYCKRLEKKRLKKLQKQQQQAAQEKFVYEKTLQEKAEKEKAEKEKIAYEKALQEKMILDKEREKEKLVNSIIQEKSLCTYPQNSTSNSNLLSQSSANSPFISPTIPSSNSPSNSYKPASSSPNTISSTSSGAPSPRKRESQSKSKSYSKNSIDNSSTLLPLSPTNLTTPRKKSTSNSPTNTSTPNGDRNREKEGKEVSTCYYEKPEETQLTIQTSSTSSSNSQPIATPTTGILTPTSVSSSPTVISSSSRALGSFSPANTGTNKVYISRQSQQIVQ